MIRAKTPTGDEFSRLKDTCYRSDTPQYHRADSRIMCHLSHHTAADVNAAAASCDNVLSRSRIERRLRPMCPVQEALHK